MNGRKQGKANRFKLDCIDNYKKIQPGNDCIIWNDLDVFV